MPTREAGLQELNKLYAEDHRFVDLRSTGARFVPGIGPVKADIMLIGESPGRSENTKGAPFVGRAGQTLFRLMEEAGLDLKKAYRTNIVKYWPHDPESFEKRDLTESELEGAVSYIRHEIDIVNPKVVGLLGYTPLHSLFPSIGSIFKVHGELLYEKYVPLYHPSVAMYRPEKFDTLVSGFRELASHVERAKAAA